MAKSSISGDVGSQAEAAQAAEFGAALRQTRIAHGRELADVAHQLRIRQPYLKAIEEGRFEALPGPTYAIGFVRAYADYLGLDETEVVKRYKELRGGAGAPANLVPPAPVTEGRLPTGSVLLLAAVLAAVAYGGWYYLSLKGRDPGELVAALPDRIAAMVGLKRAPAPVAAPTPAPAPPPVAMAPAPSTPEPSGAPRSPPTATAPPAEAPGPVTGFAPLLPAVTTAAPPAPAAGPPRVDAPAPATTPEPVLPAAPERSAAAPAPTPETPPATAPAAPSDPSTPATPPAAEPASPSVEAEPPSQTATAPAAEQAARPNAPPTAPEPAGQVAARGEAQPAGRVVVRANTSSWVEIRNAEDIRVFSRLMRSGETYTVPMAPGLTLTTGNAGGLAIMVDGRTLPPLGQPGDVRRDVALDADTLLRNAGSAP